MQFQSHSRWVVASTDEAGTVDELIEKLGDEVDAYPNFTQVLLVVPQPFSPVPVLLEVPLVAAHVGMVPVCVQLCRVRSPDKYWFDYFLPDLRLSDVQLELGDDRPAGARVFVGERTHCLTADDEVTLQRGELIKVVAPGAANPRGPLLANN